MPNEIKLYPPTWEGDLVLACRKCQRKLKGTPGMRALAKLKKAIKRRNQEHPGAVLHVINVPCMDLCPKNGVTVCIPEQPTKLAVLHDEQGIDQLYRHG
jgi:predicted metal-binding protein